jgi:enoyl-[acyl-carrier protein] reductase II
VTTIVTNVTRMLAIDLPIVQAGMSWASSSSPLPLAVSNSGGLGVIAAGPMRLPDLQRAMTEMAEGTDAPWAVNLPLYREGAADVIGLLLRRSPRVLIASQGSPKRYLRQFHDVGTICLHVVASVEHAQKAAELGVDGLVVVGAEAGGHPPPSMVTTAVLVRAVVRALPGVPVVASGGFADGAGLAAALALGAGGAQFGTRFLASKEASVHEAYKAAVVAAGVADSRVVSSDRGAVRVIANKFTDRMSALDAWPADPAVRREAFNAATLKAAAKCGDVANGKVEAGQSAGLVNDIPSAATLVNRIVTEYCEAIMNMSQPSSGP